MGHQLRPRHDDQHDHDDEHGHDHGSGLARLVHPVTELFGGHSHDSADQVDSALESDAAGRRALVISLAGLLATAALQAIVVVISGSVALLGDTLHNFADALTAVPLLIAFRLARRPANTRYTYGYGRAEDLAGLFVIAVITLSAVLAGYEAIERLLHPRPVQHRISVGRRIGSAALVADGLHARTDGFTSLAVLLGALGVGLGWPRADPLIGLLITVAILGVLRSAVAQVGARLMDAVDPHLVEQATAALADVDGIRHVDQLRIRWIGHTLRAEAAITLDPDLSLTSAHDIAHHAEAHLLADVPRLTAATIHANPAGAHR
jgi:divalent metal cation (Fe/Co/Zn/Cd) transporter